MKPTIKAALITFGTIAATFIVPAAIIILHEYLNLIFVIITYTCFFTIITFTFYNELVTYISRHDLEEQKIFAGFNHDPEKIRFYKGFKLYFDGSLNDQQLKEWLIRHPRKH